MSRQAKPPRLWLRKMRAGRPAAWFILDGKRQIGTRCGFSDRFAAENELMKYVQAKEAARRPLYLYFLTTERAGFPIKIGTTIAHKTRFEKIQTSLPYKIKILASMSTDDQLFERRLHKKFEHLRLLGEWFEPAPELLAYIDELISSQKAA